MNLIVEKALSLWGLTGSQYRLLAARENAVYQVMTNTGAVALRLHRQDYRTDQQLRSELQWMAAIAAGGIQVPSPIASESGNVLHIIDNTQVDVLTWLSGTPLVDRFTALSAPERHHVFYAIGQNMAKLHEISDTWIPPEGFTRCAWNRDGLLGDSPLWDSFWDNPELSFNDRQLFLELREKANEELAQIEDQLDYGLIHADLVHTNVLIEGDVVKLIDFDDGGYGFRVFDIATTLLKNLGEDKYQTLKASLISGYTSVRTISLANLDLFMVLRSATYVGWNIARINEEGGTMRNAKFINRTRRLAQNYLSAIQRTY